jgi:glycosyltransferase involved in cell wall biosynthesis
MSDRQAQTGATPPDARELRTLVVFQDEQLASSRIRAIQLAPHLERRGIRCTLSRFADASAAGAAGFDVVVLQKKLLSLADRLCWRGAAAPIIFDFDDAIFLRDVPRRGTHASATRARRFRATLRLCAGAVCGNGYLASACTAGLPVLVAPSPVPHDVPQRDHGAAHAVPRIGWIGMGGNLPMLEAIRDELAAAHRRMPFELHVISDRRLEAGGVPVVNHRWSLETQHELLATLDAGLMPMDDTPWTRGKCAYKALQYMAAGVPPLAGDAGMNREVIAHGANGLLVAPGAWEAALAGILADAGLRRRLGAAGRQTVLDRFTYDRFADLWARFLRSRRAAAPR